jgi:hypothetical protein
LIAEVHGVHSRKRRSFHSKWHLHFWHHWGEWNLCELPKTILGLPLDDQLAALPELMAAYRRRYNGFCPFFGRLVDQQNPLAPRLERHESLMPASGEEPIITVKNSSIRRTCGSLTVPGESAGRPATEARALVKAIARRLHRLFERRDRVLRCPS